MSKLNRFDRLEAMLEHMEPAKLLEEIVRGMSESEAEESFDYIQRMWGIFEEEDE